MLLTQSRPARAFLCLVAGLATALAPSVALACGCFTPPLPGAIEGDEYAVNQLAEQIIFEVPGDGTISAHVLIRYNGSPDQFAWLVPVPSNPTLELSENVLFGLVDDATRPEVPIGVDNRCPSPEYYCDYHPEIDCSANDSGPLFGFGGGTSASAGDGAGGGGGQTPGVTVIATQQVGSYDTVTFAADEATAAVDWLTTNDFIVNETTTPFMQPYLDDGMLFVAARLIPGADTDEIKPLKMTYEWPRPIIPLRITAVAAEPHLAITSYIYANEEYRAMGREMVTLDASKLSSDVAGRSNYPMLLTRTIDEAGGDAFVTEYSGAAPAGFTDTSGSDCCGYDQDWCGLASNGQCECPGDAFDQADCSEIDGLVESVTLMDDLRAKYSALTRITTRMSPEEMSFDPQFEPVGEGAGSTLGGRLYLYGTRVTLAGCEDDVIDQEQLAKDRLMIACAATYCGPGECVATEQGAGCVCDAAHVARTFTDLDGQASVTCIPETALVDFGLNVDLPSACTGVVLADGDCVDVGGFPASRCQGSTASVLAPGVSLPDCLPVDRPSGSPGAEDFSQSLRELTVCAPRPPECSSGGWLVVNEYKYVQGEICDYSLETDQSRFVVPPEPTCDSCAGGPPSGTLWWLVALGLLVARITRQRRDPIAPTV